MLEVDHPWTSTGSSGGLTPVYTDGFQTESVLVITHSTLASSNSISFQTGLSSAGPWIIEATGATGSTGLSSGFAIRVTGPYKWMRPYFHSASTGSFTLRLVAQS